MGRKKLAPGLKKTSAQKSKERRDRLKREDPDKFYADESARKKESRKKESRKKETRKKESRKRTQALLSDDKKDRRTAVGTVYVSVMAYIFIHVISWKFYVNNK